jgi:hypothetical protein
MVNIENVAGESGVSFCLKLSFPKLILAMLFNLFLIGLIT